MIKIQNVLKKYHGKEMDVVAVDGVSCEFPNKGMFFLLGKSGCGKTTFLNILSGLDYYDYGSIQIDGRELNQLDEQGLDLYRNRDIGIIFQEYNLIQELSAYDNIALASRIQEKEDKKILCRKVKRILEFVGLTGYDARMMNELSGGQRQRVAIARALIKRPRIILADEPTGNLDSNNGIRIIQLLKQISLQCLVIVVSHDAGIAYEYGDGIIHMEDGRMNEILAESQNIEYSVICGKEKDESQEITMGLNRAALNNYISQQLNESMENQEQLELKIKSTLKRDKEEASQKSTEEMSESEKLITGRLEGRDKLKFCRVFLKKKKLRLLVSILLLAITMFLFCFVVHITNYNEHKVITDYLNRYRPTFLIPEKEVAYDTTFHDKKEKVIYSGKGIHMLLSQLGSVERFHGMKKDCSLELEKTGTSQDAVTLIFSNGPMSMYELAEGHWPEKSHEICVTDYIARKLGIVLGDSIKDQYMKYSVTGIIKTDYLEYSLEQKLYSNSKSEYLQYFFEFYYNVAVVDKVCVEEIIDNCRLLYLKSANFFLGDRETSYLECEDVITYGYIPEGSKLLLRSGRLPEQENEVVVSETFAEQYKETKKGKFVDLEQKKYNGYYYDCFNIYPILPSGVKVVGVFLEENDIECQVAMKKELFNTLATAYYQEFYDYYALETEKSEYSSMVSEMSVGGCGIKEPAVYKIHTFSNMLNDIIPVLYVLLGAIFILSVLMISNYISVSIRENNKNIGILRAVGVRKKDVLAIFLYETIFVYLLSLVVSLVAVQVFLVYINKLFRQTLTERMYSIILFDGKGSVGVYLIMLVSCLVCVIIPIKKLAKKKPIEIIRTS